MKNVISLFLFIFSINVFSQNIRLDKIKLPPGFKIVLFADNIETARGLTVTPGHTVFVGSKDGKVYALKDRNKDGRSDEVFIIADNLDMPVGVDFYKGDLYVSEVSRIIKFSDIEINLGKKMPPIVINSSFPGDRAHGWKFIKFGPDDKLYVPVGAPCNVCLSKDERYASIMRMNPNGTALEIFARGIRNTVGFDWHPDTKELWFTDNGRDHLSDNIPPDELNYAPVSGLHFGFPYVHGKNIIDPDFGKNINIEGFKKPELELSPHAAALGMRFYTGNSFPKEYKDQIFIAEHGSWNRSIPIGYRITTARFNKGKKLSYEVFAEGWLLNGVSWGRPVDIEIFYDGSILVSDDKANAVYRIYYED